MILKGERVSLRPILNKDFEYYFKWHSNKELRIQTAMHPFSVSEENEKKWFDNIISDMSNRRILFTVVNNDNSPIGYFQLTDVNMINKNAMLGIVIGEKSFQGKGIGKEILDLGCSYAFQSLGLLKISLDVVITNKEAIALYQRTGFVQEGRFIKQYFSEGLYFDILRMAHFNKSVLFE